MYDSTCSRSIGSDELNEIDLQAFLDRYENEPIKIRCGICHTTERLTRRQLEKQGWVIYGRAQYCPSH
jgi:hypothetical protein